MPREIWNEGRVVGMSAYETYVKQHVIEDPTTPPATEREWLASSLAMGNSMILNVPATSDTQTDEHYYVDIPLPNDTRLAAANTILAQFFEGDAEFNDNWATRVTDYGSLISNTYDSHPEGSVPGGAISIGVPVSTIADWSDTQKEQLKGYMRIVDGIVLQPGTWSEWEVPSVPERDVAADLSRPYPVVRLHIKGKIASTARPKVLLTGFTIRTVLSGTVGTDSSLQTESPQDGDFLGPAVFPWANKIIFSVPNSYIAYFAGSGDYRRSLKSPTSESPTTQTKTIKDTPVIDMQASKPETFYSAYASYYSKYSNTTTNPRYAYDVSKFSTLGDAPTDGEAVLTVYQKKDIYPPALYGTFVNSISSGDHKTYLNPLDIVAPGSIKAFNNVQKEDLVEYQTTFPGTRAINIQSDGTIQLLNSDDELVTIRENYIYGQYLTNSGQKFKAPHVAAFTGNDRPGLVKLRTTYTDKYALALSLNDTVTNPSMNYWYFNGTKTVSTTPEYVNGISSISPVNIQYQRPSKEYANTVGTGLNEKAVNHAINVYSEWVDGEVDHPESFANLNWSMLIAALQTNRSIDLLGYRLKSARYSLTRDCYHAEAPYLEFGPNTMLYREGSGWVTNARVKKDNINIGATPNTITNLGTANHIVRLYLTNVAPATYAMDPDHPNRHITNSLDTLLNGAGSIAMELVPVGSIGMGWNFTQNANTNFIGIWVCRPFAWRNGSSGSYYYELCWASVTDARTAVYDSTGSLIPVGDRGNWRPITPDPDNPTK